MSANTVCDFTTETELTAHALRVMCKLGVNCNKTSGELVLPSNHKEMVTFMKF